MIYVDNMQIPFGRMKMCHMWTDGELDGLHIFAQKLGLKHKWFQPDNRLPHYDISLSKRAKAIKMGAVDASWKDTANEMKRRKKCH